MRFPRPAPRSGFRLPNARLTRRQWLERLGRAAVLGCLAQVRPRRVMAAAGPPRVLIVGGGMAGLAAAGRLREQGIESLVLEARDRLGGRILTDTSLGCPLDLGASWIHGPDNNPFTALAERWKIRTAETPYSNVLLWDETGRKMDVVLLLKCMTRFDDWLESAVQTAIDSPRDQSLEAAARQFVAGLSPDERRVWYGWLSDLEAWSAADAAEISLKQFDDVDELEGVDRLVLDGYSAFVDRLGAGVPTRSGQAVRLIRHHARGVEVETENERFTAEAAIVTVPLGVLKREAIRFDPPLPERKRTAISRLGFGAFEKVGLRFPRRFWPEATFLGLASPEPVEFPGFLDLGQWSGTPVLVGYSVGRFARGRRGQSPQAVADRAVATLRTMLGRQVPEPEAVVTSRWSEDPWAGGSYSFLSVGGEGADHDVLAEPAGPRVFFAGEATYRRVSGTVSGAYLSGQRAADECRERLAAG